MKWCCWLLGAALGVVISSVAQSSETVIRFEPPSLPRGSRLIGSYSENGMVFSTPNGMGHTDVGVGLYPSNGTAYLTFGANHSPLTIRESLGQSFDLLSVDLAEYSTVFPQPWDLTFTGYKPDGSVVSTVVRLDGLIDGTGALADFQTFSFDARFSALNRLQVTPERYSLDNLRLALTSTNPPSPVLPAEPQLTVPRQSFPEITTNGCRLVVESGGPVTYVVECSLDLLQWTPIHTNTLAGGAREFCDREASGGVRRFYRVRPQ